jgi:hypothetical protein
MRSEPLLFQLLADPRIGGLVLSPRPAFVTGQAGALLLANGAGLTFLAASSQRGAAAAIAADPRAFGKGFAASRLEVRGVGPVTLHVGVPSGGTPDAVKAASALFDDGAAYLVVDASGRQVAANERGARIMDGRTNLNDLVADAHHAIARAHTQGHAAHGFADLRATLRRVGSDVDPYFIVALPVPEAEPKPEPAAPMREPEPQPMLAQAEPAAEAPAADASEAAVQKASVGPPREQAPEPIASVQAPAEAASEPEPDAEESPEPAPIGAVDTRSANDDLQRQTTAAPPAEDEKPRPPSRFVWQTDAEGRFTSVSPELAAVVGEAAAALSGRDWNEAGSAIGIDGAHAVAKAVARRDTWSGVSVLWPIDGSDEVRPIDLAALPAFDRERRFLGYRGFGVFRDPIARPAEKEKAREATSPAREQTTRVAPPALVEQPENVVPLHRGETTRPTLTAIERNAFREIAKAIGDRMQRVGPARNRRAPLPPARSEPTGEATMNAPFSTGCRSA